MEGRHVDVGDTIEYLDDNNGLWLKVRLLRIMDSGWKIQCVENSFADWIKPDEVQHRLRLGRVANKDEDDDENDEEMEDKDDEEKNEIWPMHEKMNEAFDGILKLDRKGKPKSSFKYQGVHQIEGNKSKPWKACIHIDGKNQRLGTYATEVEAARASDGSSSLYSCSSSYSPP